MKKAKRPRAWNSTLAAPTAPTLKRSAMKRGGKIRPKKRSAKETERIYGPTLFRSWIHRQPCVVSGVRGNIECVHVVTGGMGRKADWTATVPMAGELHRELHRIGIKSFEAKYDINLVALAAKTRARYLAYVHQQESTQ